MDTRVLQALHRYHYISKPLLQTIAKDPEWAYWYADEVLKGPFKLGEPAIAEDSMRAYWYAAEILEGPFPLGEPTIAKDPRRAYWYARGVLHLPEDQARQWSKQRI